MGLCLIIELFFVFAFFKTDHGSVSVQNLRLRSDAELGGSPGVYCCVTMN